MADDDYDFFAPQPKPQPRVKNTLFDVVEDAFSPRTLELTGDQRRVKTTSGTSTPAQCEPDKMPVEKTPVEETIKQYVVKEVEAEMWQGAIISEETKCKDRVFGEYNKGDNSY